MLGKRILVGVALAALCALIAVPARAEERIMVLAEGQVVSMSMEAYLTCVVAAEMPASYAMEALKAQAVAARTRAAGGRCLSHPEADVCTDSACCQGYLDQEGQRARWGVDTPMYSARIREAVESTSGIIMTYLGRPIEVMYHAVSGGHTEDVERVYTEALPYLRGVDSPGEEGASGYETVTAIPMERLVAIFPDEVREGVVKIEVLSRTESGRVQSVRVGGHMMTGRLLRSALGLKSTNFRVEYGSEEIVVYQRGYGHGVGMSQAGADAMARAGAHYEDILLHYYTGVTLSMLDDF